MKEIVAKDLGFMECKDDVAEAIRRYSRGRGGQRGLRRGLMGSAVIRGVCNDAVDGQLLFSKPGSRVIS